MWPIRLENTVLLRSNIYLEPMQECMESLEVCYSLLYISLLYFAFTLYFRKATFQFLLCSVLVFTTRQNWIEISVCVYILQLYFMLCLNICKVFSVISILQCVDELLIIFNLIYLSISLKGSWPIKSSNQWGQHNTCKTIIKTYLYFILTL